VPADTSTAYLRSFKHRRGRTTAGQQAALDTLWSRYGLPQAPLDARAAFGREAPLVLEIGFGMGEATLAMAAADPARDLLAVDVHLPGVGALLRGADAQGLGNVRVLVGDAVDVLQGVLPVDALDEIRIFFPDPWPKTRHRKRRLFSPAFARLAASRLRSGGRLHLATDWTPYAEQVLDVLRQEPQLRNDYPGYAPRPAWRPQTRFELQGLAHGRPAHDILARRRAPAPTA
jgi:tRNA (guanine-N7-)-methyltransferase